MFEKIGSFFNKLTKPEVKELTSKDAAKERLHLVLMQDRANVSVDFLELMKQEIIDVIKKYIVIDESAIDVRLTNQENEDGTNGAPSLYANIPIINIKNEVKAEKIKDGTLMYENGELEKAPVQEETNTVQEAQKVEQVGAVEPVEEPVPVESVEPVQGDNTEQEVVNNEDNDTVEEVEKKSSNEESEIAENVTEKEQELEEVVIQKEEEPEEAIEPIVDFNDEDEIDDEDGEDVTFDDLLKKAEAEEKENEESEVGQDIESEDSSETESDEEGTEIGEIKKPMSKKKKPSKRKKR